MDNKSVPNYNVERKALCDFINEHCPGEVGLTERSISGCKKFMHCESCWLAAFKNKMGEK